MMGAHQSRPVGVYDTWVDGRGRTDSVKGDGITQDQ
jgi:hypothetical protein